MPFRQNPVIPADSGAIPADSGAILVELLDSGQNLWGTVKYWIASATLPEHVLNDIQSKLRLAQDVKMIRVTNAHPNVALSVRRKNLCRMFSLDYG